MERKDRLEYLGDCVWVRLDAFTGGVMLYTDRDSAHDVAPPVDERPVGTLQRRHWLVLDGEGLRALQRWLREVG